VPFDPEHFKLATLDDHGVRFLLHAFAGGVTAADAKGGVVFETTSGPLVLDAHAIVDFGRRRRRGGGRRAVRGRA